MKKRTWLIVDYVLPANHKVKIKKGRETWALLEKLENCGTWKKGVILIVIDALGTVPKSMERELEELKIRGWAETIQPTALLRSARILWRVLKTWRVLLSLTKTPMKYHQITLVWKTCLEYNNNGIIYRDNLCTWNKLWRICHLKKRKYFDNLWYIDVCEKYFFSICFFFLFLYLFFEKKSCIGSLEKFVASFKKQFFFSAWISMKNVSCVLFLHLL